MPPLPGRRIPLGEDFGWHPDLLPPAQPPPHVWGPSPSVKLEGFGIREVGIRDELGMG